MRNVTLSMTILLCMAVSQAQITETQFVFDRAPFAECHASTIAKSGDNLVCAWFAGTEEGHPDVGIWLSRNINGKWTAPVEVVKSVTADGVQYPCWNPVLYQDNDELLLFYKVGRNPRTWWGMMTRSDDNGKTWSTPERLPYEVQGPIKNKPVKYKDMLLCGTSTEYRNWRVHFEWTKDGGRTWNWTAPVNDGSRFSIIQPTLLVWPGDKIQALCRSRQGRIDELWSQDGKNWSTPQATELPNSSAGIDAVMLQDGRALLVYNHTVRHGPRPRDREMLNVAVTKDGKTWNSAFMLENTPDEEFSYPAVIQTPDGTVHITYTWKRLKIRYIALDPSKLRLTPIKDGKWPFLEQ